MDPQLIAQLKETIHVSTVNGVDAAGDPGFNAPVARSARVVNVRDTVERDDGTVVKTTVAVITEAAVDLSSRLWLPGVDSADATLARVPRYIERAVDEFGNLDFYRTKL